MSTPDVEPIVPEQSPADVSPDTESSDSYLQELQKAFSYSVTEFDKSVSLISTGMLAASYAFVDKMVDLKKAIRKPMLIDGWYILGIAILVSLLGHYLNIWILKYAIKDHYKKEDDKSLVTKYGDLLVHLFNVGSIILIIIGSFMVIKFIRINLY